MSKELRPLACPFCGNEPQLSGGYEGPCVICENRKCAIRPRTDNYENADEAIAAWNLRASPTPTTDGRGIVDKGLELIQALNKHDIGAILHGQAYTDVVGAKNLLAVAINDHAALLSSPTEGREAIRREALEEAARVAEKLADELARLKGSSDRRVQIGSHLETCATIAASIRSLSPPDGDGKQEQATRAEDGPTAPTDRL